MNPVKSYNVIVSNEPKSVEEIISIVKSGNRILKEDLLLFSNLNDNIISFEHQYNFNEKGNKGSLIKLEIIDPEKVFL